jgi:hypothetical protein
VIRRFVHACSTEREAKNALMNFAVHYMDAAVDWKSMQATRKYEHHTFLVATPAALSGLEFHAAMLSDSLPYELRALVLTRVRLRG